MKRKIAPEQREKIFKENIFIDLKEDKDLLIVNFQLKKTSSFEQEASIILEAYTRNNIERFQVGFIKDYDEEKKEYKLPSNFSISLRAKINFRLKIIDTKTYKILGLAENLKEEKYNESLLNLVSGKIKSIYKVDFDNPKVPILYFNSEISDCLEKLKPIIAEMAFKEILNYLLFRYDDQIDEHKWFNFACSFKKPDFSLEEDDEEKELWINEVVELFAKKRNCINKIKEIMSND